MLSTPFSLINLLHRLYQQLFHTEYLWQIFSSSVHLGVTAKYIRRSPLSVKKVFLKFPVFTILDGQSQCKHWSSSQWTLLFANLDMRITEPWWKELWYNVSSFTHTFRVNPRFAEFHISQCSAMHRWFAMYVSVYRGQQHKSFERLTRLVITAHCAEHNNLCSFI